MANLAIKGHQTRGNEIIEIFEALGGVNTDNNEGDWEIMYYLLEDMPIMVHSKRVVSTYKSIEIHSGFALKNQKEKYAFFTLEEFLEKFPYKIGDKVTLCRDKSIWEISGFKWDSEVNIIKYIIKRESDCVSGWHTTDELQPYKEENYDLH
jgi:hypothetical protein